MAGLALALIGCGGGDDYYFLNDIKGGGDTVVFEFIYTCGNVEFEWDGGFGKWPQYTVDLHVKHDASGDCEENHREIAYDVGPIKRAFRDKHPWPAGLVLRVAPYEEEQGAICLPNLFQEVFKGKRCK